MDFEAARIKLIEHLSREINDKKVLNAMADVHREHFVPPENRCYAYEDRPLPIGWDQTISQPYMVALMTQALAMTGREKVLEVGTGSGYQAAILAHLAEMVVTTERIPFLADNARQVLGKLGYSNITVHVTEHTLGWEQEAPYDAILVTAGAPAIPSELVAQLRVGGRIVMPVGTRRIQQLVKITRQDSSNFFESLGGCQFVPLIGKNAWAN